MGSVKITDTDWEKYRQEVFYSAKNKRNFLIGNFSFKGFNYIFDALIENTEFKLVFLLKILNQFLINQNLNLLNIDV